MSLSMPVQVGLGVCLAAGLAFAATPLAIWTARRFAFYDLPRGYKAHAKPTPYLGGAAVMLAFTVATLAAAGHVSRTLPLLAAGAVLVVVGTVDDRRTVSPQLRVVVELGLGALVAVLNIGWHLGGGLALDCLVTGLWVVGVVNAFNLFDNMDGASSTMAVVAAGGICALSLVTGNAWVAVGSAALSGACLGFLPHNLSSPAKIFLGDGGSMPIGFAVAVLAANVAGRAEPGLLGLLVGFLLVGVPALDTALVIVSRRRRGVSVLTAGRDHLTHRTRLRMKTPVRVATVLGGAQAIVSAAVIVASRAGQPELVYIVLAMTVLAVTAIVALEDAIPLPEVGSARTGPAKPGRPSRIAAIPVPEITLGVIGLGAGLSALFSAYYSPVIWVAIGLCLVVAAAMATLARPPRVTLAVALLVVGLAGLGLWSLLSTVWASAVEQATRTGNLWLAYTALALVIVLLITRRRHAVTLLGCAGLGIAVVGVSVLVRMLGGDPGAMFLGGRLNSPLGYINGEACVFAMGIWFGVALGERRQPVLAGLGAATGVVMAGLALLSQSRGAAIATAVAVVLALVVIPGWRRRILVLATVAAGFAVASRAVLRVYSVGHTGAAIAGVSHHAVLVLVGAATGTGVVWGLIVLAGGVLGHSRGLAPIAVRRGATAAAVAVVIVPLALAAANAPQLERTIRTQWYAFVHLRQSEGSAGAAVSAQTRLFSGAGNRYDYWRVASQVFVAHPLIGVGAGSYTPYYFRYRRTLESIENPHSLELQTLSELGLIGAVLLVLALAGAGMGMARLRSRARHHSTERGLMVVATGVAVVWLVDTSGDWMHLLPGVTAIALAAMAVLARMGDTGPADSPTLSQSADSARPPRRLPHLLGAATVIFVLAVAGASLLRAGLARHYLDEARAALHGHPTTAINTAERVIRLDAADLDAYYVKAAGQARFDHAQAARETLLAAVAQDRSDFVTWALLGDLEVRAGNARAARAYYRRALTLDPREPSLRMLVAEPAKRLLQSAR